jgi:AraC-like DNA-binding protein
MQIAQSALQTEGATVAELADRLGYKSEAAFARAFKRVSGIPPGAVKRRGETQKATSGGLAPAMGGS